MGICSSTSAPTTSRTPRTSDRGLYLDGSFEVVVKLRDLKALSLQALNCCAYQFNSSVETKPIPAPVERRHTRVLRHGKFKRAAVAELPLVVKPRRVDPRSNECFPECQ